MPGPFIDPKGAKEFSKAFGGSKPEKKKKKKKKKSRARRHLQPEKKRGLRVNKEFAKGIAAGFR